MDTPNRLAPLVLAAVLVLPAFPLAASITMFNGGASGTDSWNTVSNWSGGVPSGDMNAALVAGTTAEVNNAVTPVYSGTLVLGNNSLLSIGGTIGSQNAVVGASAITLGAASELRWNLNAGLNFPPITLEGDALFLTPFGASDHETDNFAAITGSYKLTINGFNNHTFNLNAANTFSELVADATDRYRIVAKAAGSLGTGDVTINKRSGDDRGCVLVIDAANAMAETATLRLHGKGWNGSGGGALAGTSYPLRMNANDTVARLFVNGVEMPPGNYTGGSQPWIGGTGTLSVVPITPYNPAPAFGAVVPAGEVGLTWTNLTPNTGTEVWVDVWFGTAPGALTQVAAGQLNLESFTISAPVAANYYWRVDSYLDGAPTGTPLTGTVFRFEVIDSDGDGIPDAWKIQYFGDIHHPDAGASEDPDLDGLTNMQEFLAGLHPFDPDTDNDGLLDSDSITVGSDDPRYTEWAALGIVFTQNGNQRTFRGENEMGTDPLNPDTDGDGLLDGVETNTGIWVSANDTGTDPLNPDTDRDGLKDGVETNTGIFVSRTNTGTDPLNPDTDGDGVGDWYEIYASLTDPLDPNDKPAVPYPLPAHGGSPGASDKPVKVYIMSGQSNMVGFGTVSGTGDHTLQTMTRQQNKFPHLIDSEGGFITRQDVRYRGVISAIGNGPLAPGFGANSGLFGPELGFGQLMGWYHDEPVLLIKSSIGNRSLGWDVLPPGSPSYVYGSTNYAGYGDFGNWPVGGEPPTSGGWYAGKEFDRFFMDESEWAHPDTAATNVVDVLDNWIAEYAAPGKPFAGQDFEIAGFVWWQGDKDRYDMGHATRYEQNLVRLITSLRSYYENRYPGEGNQFPFGRVAPDAPFVLATLGQTPLNSTNAAEKAILDAQLAVDGEAGKYEQFAGNVKTVYAHPLSEGGASNSHYNGRAGTYLLVGDALGRAMVDLLGNVAPPGDGYAGWVNGPFSGTLTDPDPTLDFDAGGLATALEWVLGGDPTDASDDAAIAPTLDNTSDPDFFIFTYRRTDQAAADANTIIQVEYGSDLAGWTTAVAGPNIEISVDDDAVGVGIDLVEVKIRRTLAHGGKLFARLKVVVAAP